MIDYTKAELLLGNEAIAIGALESGVALAACYPGTPSSEIIGTLQNMLDRGYGCSPESLAVEYSINEKVALEVACGAALAGKPALAAMKHVGLNVAADPLLTSAYIGMPGSLVIVSADDPGCHSSQNEQDNRHYARLAKLPCFEPATPQEALEMTKAAFQLSRKLEQPVLLRVTTRLCHMRGPVFRSLHPPLCHHQFPLDPHRFVPVPAVAKKRHAALLENMAKAALYSEETPFNNFTIAENSSHGIIASGVSRSYLADVLNSISDKLNIFNLGMTWPLPEAKLKEFFSHCDEILVLEEGDPILETELKALAGAAKISGKNAQMTETGEYSTGKVGRCISHWLKKTVNEPEFKAIQLPGRPPNLCPGCGHRSIYYAVRKVFGNDAVYSNDIGCYALGFLPPLSAADFMICMGSSISAGSGHARVTDDTVISYIGDSTFFHSGLTGLANALYNNHDQLIIILDNGTTAMTGHQRNPAMPQEAMGEKATHLDIDRILDGMGVTNRITVKAHNLKAVEDALQKLRPLKGVRVLHAVEPCLLFAKRQLGKKINRVAEIYAETENVRKCVAELGCPAFTRKDGKLAVDPQSCGGCMLCIQIAPDGIRAGKVAIDAQ